MTKPQKKPDRRPIYCLLCNKLQLYLSTHLKKRCMAGQSPQKRSEELQRAKEAMKVWILRERSWDYHQIREWCPEPSGRFSLLTRVQRDGYFILNPPDEEELNFLKEAAAPSLVKDTPSAPQEPDEVGGPRSASASEEEDSATLGIRKRRSATRKGARRSLRQSGLYKQVASDDPLLSSYAGHLKDDLKRVNFKQEVANVSRWLGFLLPEAGKVSVDFVRRVSKMEEYVGRLKSAGLAASTICKSAANLARFTEYVQKRSDPEESTDCELFLKALGSVTEKLRSERVQGRSPKLAIRPTTTYYACQKILRCALKDIKQIKNNMDEGRHVSEEERTKYRYFCVALFLLKLCQRPAVVKKLTAKEWMERTTAGGFAFVTHHADGKPSSSFAISAEDEAILDLFFCKIRPRYLEGKDVAEECFFLTQSGLPISSAQVELSRLHRHYGLPSVSSKDVRRVLRQEARLLEEDMKLSLLAYLGQSQAAEDSSPPAALSFTQLMLVACYLDAIAGSREGHRTRKRGLESSEEGAGKDLGTSLKKFPVTLDGNSPSKRRSESVFTTDGPARPVEAEEAGADGQMDPMGGNSCQAPEPPLELVGKLTPMLGGSPELDCPLRTLSDLFDSPLSVSRPIFDGWQDDQPFCEELQR